MSLTDDPSHPGVKRGPPDEKPVPQHDTYLVLSAEERAKGFVRPVRRSYAHVGRQVCGKVRQGMGDDPTQPWLCILAPRHEGECGAWHKAKDIGEIERAGKHHLLGGCGTVTTMGQALSETYARDPHFYGATYCCGCMKHRPVGRNGEFVWQGTNERVGT